jgi:hypothetical protein
LLRGNAPVLLQNCRNQTQDLSTHNVVGISKKAHSMTDESKYIIIPGEETPVELMKEFPSRSVTMVGLRHDREPRHCGSGTLVRLEDQHYLLTAAHCAHALAKCEEIGLPIRRDKHPFILPVIDPIYIGQPESEEWGPDLAFLSIPSVKASHLLSYTNYLFYDLGRYKDEMLEGEPEVENALWVVTGAPACISNLEDPKNLVFTKMTYAGGVMPPITRGNFDYIEIRAALELEAVPSNFKGMSGGGLWHTKVGRKKDGTFVTLGGPKLEGCAFYETRPQGEYVYIRCHGRRSIYEHGVSRLLEMKR